jgi:phospholipid/cholesterol/gamma-HCH transport system substrate-binding protein
VNLILKDVAGKLHKLDKTIDNINKISTQASEGMEDFSILRSDIDDVVRSLDNAVKKLEAIIGAKNPPEFKKP